MAKLTHWDSEEDRRIGNLAWMMGAEKVYANRDEHALIDNAYDVTYIMRESDKMVDRTLPRDERLPAVYMPSIFNTKE